jgi:hypothetical protein
MAGTRKRDRNRSIKARRRTTPILRRRPGVPPEVSRYGAPRARRAGTIFAHVLQAGAVAVLVGLLREIGGRLLDWIGK